MLDSLITISGTFRNIFDGGCYTQITEVTLTFTVVSSNGNSILSELVSASFESLRETLLTPVRIWKRACWIWTLENSEGWNLLNLYDFLTHYKTKKSGPQNLNGRQYYSAHFAKILCLLNPRALIAQCSVQLK